MATVSFEQNSDTWLATRWVFAAFLEHVLARLSEYALRKAVEEAIAFENLDFAGLEPEVAHGLSRSMLDVAREVSEGKLVAQTEGRVLDDDSQEQFRRKVQELERTLIRMFPAGVVP